MSLRKIFYNTVYRTYNDRLSFETLYPEVLKGLNDRDKRRLINLVNLFFRNFNFLEKFLADKVENNIPDQDLKTEILILCAGIEYFWLDSSTDYSVVNDFVELSKEVLGEKKSKYINAILRKMTSVTMTEEDKSSKQAIYGSHPQWVTDKLIEQYGKPVTEDIYRFNQTVPPLYARANRVKNDRDGLAEILESEGVETAEVENFPDFLEIKSGNAVNSKALRDGRFYIQDPSHSVPVLLLDPHANEKILDLCCAPGGKSTYIQEISGNSARLWLNDISQKKRVIIKLNFKRLGLIFDKLSFQEAQKFQEFIEFDKILIDAPCTGSGNFRRHPESRWNKSEEMLSELKKLQLAILKRATIYVRKGGSIVYSTCSIFQEENMDIVKAFLEHEGDFAIDTPDIALLEPFKNQDGSFSVIPGVHGHEGAFAVRLKRVR
ncbi:MAG: transcription antitermination factor NusB [Candidatus Delongbacteria bacterium]